MKLAIHPKIKGKAKKILVDGEFSHWECEGQRVNLGWGWQNIEVSWNDAFKLITEDGYATSSELLSDHRDENNFVSRELIMVDIDSGMTIEELLANDWYNQYGAGFYITPSYTDNMPRFRIMFRLSQALTDAHRLRKINRALITLFAQADQACKDPTRIFYGTPNCRIFEQSTKIIDKDFEEVLVKITEQLDQEQEFNRSETTNYIELTDIRRRRILDLLKQTYVGNYPIWRNVAWGLKQGGFSLTDFQYVTQGMMNQKSDKDALLVWAAGRPDGDITMGTVIHLLKQHHGADCLHFNEQDEVEDLRQRIEQRIIKLREI
jgi:hypothetical protein